MMKIISYCKRTVITSLMLFTRRDNPCSVIARRAFCAAAIQKYFLDCFANSARNDGILAYLKNTRLAITTLITILTLCASLTGCISSKYVEQKQYLLAVEKPISKHKINKKSSLYIDHITTQAPFDQLNFLYRVSKYQYLTDYYNGFLVPPAKQLEAMLINHINNFSKFTIQNSALSASNTLQVQLTEFYADYLDSKNPKAIISIHFTLIGANDSKIILDKIFTQKIALQTKNTASLLSAWNIGLQNIATNATRSLNQCIK